MRRFAITTIALLGLAAPGAALAQGAAQPPAPPSTQAPAQPAAPAAADAADVSRSLFEPTVARIPHRGPLHERGRRSGALPALPGPARRAAVLELPLLVRQAGRYVGLQRARRERRLPRPGVHGEFRPDRQAVAHRQLAADSAVLQRRYDDAVYGHRRHAGARRRDAARDPERRQANLNAYVPLAPAFELRERRDIGRVDLVATPKPNLDVTANFTTQKHSGELPWGASFGFSNDVEVALPYDSRANDFTIGTEWTNTRNMLRVAYTGSWFDNLAPTLTWDSPLRLDDNADAGPGRGRMSLWPSNSAQTISFAGYTKLAHKTQVTGSFSYGLWSNDEALEPFTINTTLPQFALPRANTEGEAHVFSTNLSLTSRPSTDWRFSARVRNYTYNNLMPVTSITNMISYDDGRLDDANGRSGPLRAQPDELRRRCHMDEADAVRGHRSATRTTGTATMRGSSSRAARTCSASPPMPSDPRGSPSGRSTSTAVAAAQGSTKRS